ncbi:MAG: YCF48-related protein [Pseudomonadota bacterium]
MSVSAVRFCGAVVASAVSLFAFATAVLAQSDSAVQPQPAIQARLADQSLLLDVTEYNGNYIAVGERGHVLLSNDGQSWQQAESVPVSATLTRVTSFDRRLWAVGHDTTIISSMDGGNSWNLQHFDPSAQEPLLDILFLNANQGIAVGAYGRIMRTADGGSTWSEGYIGDLMTSEAIDWGDVAAQDSADADEFADDQNAGDLFELLDKGCYEMLECHLNEIMQVDERRLLIAAERGYGYRSEDAGETWESFRFPYSGSMFGLVPKGGCIVAFGLRGHIQRSCNFADSWEILVTDGEESLLGGTVGGDGEIILVGSGATRISIDLNLNIDRTFDRLGSDYAAVLQTNSGHLILVGEDGVRYE